MKIHHRSKFSRGVVCGGLPATLFFAISAVAQPVTPTTTPSSSAAACSKADVDAALGATPSCDTSGIVAFGQSAEDFIVSQCSTISAPNQTADVTRKNTDLCIRCANRARDAFRAAAKAGLVTPIGKRSVGSGRIRNLCKITDDGKTGDGKQDPEQSPAQQTLFSGLRLCLPQEGAPVEPAQCVQCATKLLDDALTNSVINQAKHDVLVSSAGRICSGKGQKGGGDNGGGGDEGGGKGGGPAGGGDGKGGPGGDTGGQPPTETPKPPTAGGGLYDAFFNGLRGCFKQFRLIATPDSVGCNTCVNALDTTGLDPARVSEALAKASQMCAGTFVPNEGGGDKSPVTPPAPPTVQ